jgi:hypothetical protein
MSAESDHADRVQLLRGESMVSSLAGAFGGQLRETRLTALLGYLIALNPDPFCKLFGFKGRALSVSLEHRHGLKRSDILIETTHGTGIVEAKIDTTDPSQQIKKYKATWHVLLTQGIAAPSERQRRNVRHVRWSELAGELDALSRQSNPQSRFVARDLLTYLEEHHMIRPKESVEVYAREINDEVSLRLFFDLNVYRCLHKKNTRLPEALYFAPHFGQSIAGSHVAIQQGISYVAKIENVETAYTWRDFNEVIQANWGKAFLKRNKALLAEDRAGWKNDDEIKRYVVFLQTPRLAFNPPIKKDNLQKGKGWLSKQFFSFDDLFRAWNGEAIHG